MSRKLQLGVKRMFDLAAAVLGLLVLLPFLALIALAIKLESRGPMLFVQERVGLRGQRFPMLKFRTMIKDAARMGSGLYVSAHDPRITRVGKLLRRLSFDELPQLVNILLGQMSIVGPRPALPYHVEHYTEGQKRRLWMRPGVTGWSQVHGRNTLPWPERIEKDIWYVDHFSFWLDAKILLRTPFVWLSGEGLYGERDKFYFTGKDDIPVPPGAGR